MINQDHYSFARVEPGRYELTEELAGTRYAYLIVRTFMDADDPADVEACNRAQDALAIEGGGAGPLDIPDWNLDQLATARDALNALAELGASNVGAFGSREQTDPINHLVFTAAGWGGLPLPWPPICGRVRHPTTCLPASPTMIGVLRRLLPRPTRRSATHCSPRRSNCSRYTGRPRCRSATSHATPA